MFPPDTPVLNRREPDLAERRWRTFRPAYLHDAAKLLHAAAMFSDPTSPPLPSRHPLTEPLVSYLRQREVLRERYDESRGHASCSIGPSASSRAPTRRCPDSSISSTGWPGSTASPSSCTAPGGSTSGRSRPRQYQARPTDGRGHAEAGPAEARLPRARARSVGDHPALLRRLGLVIELRVADPARLLTSDWLSARVVPRGDTKAGRLTRVAVKRWATPTSPSRRRPNGTTAGSASATPSASRCSTWIRTAAPSSSTGSSGRCRGCLAVEQNGDPIHAAPTALRSTGFTGGAVRAGPAARSTGRPARPSCRRSSGPAGLRCSRPRTSPGAFASRCGTTTTRRGRPCTPGTSTSRSSVSASCSMTSRSSGSSRVRRRPRPSAPRIRPVHVHESMFGWDGWSLAAPKPGLRVRHVNPPTRSGPTASPSPRSSSR